MDKMKNRAAADGQDENDEKKVREYGFDTLFMQDDKKKGKKKWRILTTNKFWFFVWK